MRKIGINLNAKKPVDLKEHIAMVKRYGFDCIFLGVPPIKQIPEIRRLLEEQGIEWETIHAPFGHMNDMWLDGEAGDIMLRELLNSVDACVLAGARIVVVHLSSGDQAPPVTDIGRRRFTELVEYAAGKGITVAFENQRKLSNLAWAIETFDAQSNVGFCWDCGHEHCFTPGREYMPIFGKRLVCTHLHDNTGEYNSDNHFLPFEGTLDFERVARQIRESGYEGSLMLEVNGSKEWYADVPTEEFYARAAEAVKRLRTMVDGDGEA